MSYKHGVYISEKQTSIIPPLKVESAIPVVFVTAPVHLSENPYGVTNIPKLCYSSSEAVSQFGFSMRPEIWNNYTAPQVIFSQFTLYAVSPIVIINVLDPKVHNTKVEGEKLKLDGYTGLLKEDGVLIDTVQIIKESKEFYEVGTHYTLSYDKDGFVIINVKKDVPGGISEGQDINLVYVKLSPKKVDIYDIIGGYDSQSGKNLGLELVNEIFPRFRIVPGQLLVPKYSSNPTVAAIMETKADNINGHFRCIAINDMPTLIENEQGNLKEYRYTDIPAWKNQNSYVSSRQLNCYPKLRLGEQIFEYSVHLAGLIGRTDSENSSVPYNSPSNKNLNINGLCYEDGKEVILTNEQANYLNGQGIITAINFTNGWVAWGNRTGAYPNTADVKNTFIPLRRMFDWIGNTIVLTYWSKIDFPLTRRTIDTIVDSINIWFNGLASREFILGGRIEFLEDDNPTTDIMDGIAKFRVSIAPPAPMREAEFILEYDPQYLHALFSN